jgi:AcrR family transcriptional regulator
MQIVRRGSHAPGNRTQPRNAGGKIDLADTFQKVAQREGDQHLVVPETLAALHETEVPDQAVTPATHSGYPAIIEHLMSMHCVAIPSILDRFESRAVREEQNEKRKRRERIDDGQQATGRVVHRARGPRPDQLSETGRCIRHMAPAKKNIMFRFGNRRITLFASCEISPAVLLREVAVNGVSGAVMSKKMIKPGRDLLSRVNQAFLDYGYSGLTMVSMAKACGFTQRALYYYFSNKEEAFRAAIADRNEEVVAQSLEAGKATRADGGSALDIFARIMDVRYGETRRILTRSPHTVELNAEAFRRCRDLMIQSAVVFQGELEKLIVDLQKKRMLKLNGHFTPAQISQALADGGRAVNQSLPPIAADDFTARYRQMCEMVLYGSAAMPRTKPDRSDRNDENQPQ